MNGRFAHDTIRFKDHDMRLLTKQNVLWVVLSMLVVTAGVAIWAVFSA